MFLLKNVAYFFRWLIVVGIKVIKKYRVLRKKELLIMMWQQ
jgi:hypothetical protein